MNKTEQKMGMTLITKVSLATGAIAAVVGIGFLITSRVQQSDPTLTKAPPPGPNAAAALRPSSQKRLHAGPMYVMGPSGGIVQNPSWGTGQATKVSSGGTEQPLVVAPAGASQ